MKVSAIVSAYKSDEYLEGCFEDLVTQSIPVEIVVIANDASVKERGIIEHYRKLFPTRFKVEYVEREPLYKSWNRAIKLTTGEYITNANSDDRHDRDYMLKMSKALDEGADVVYADQIVSQTIASFKKQHRIAKQVMKRTKFDSELFSYGYYLGSQPMWRKSLHDKYGYYNEEFFSSGDWEFFLRLAHDSKGEVKFVHVPEILGSYYNNPNGIFNTHPERVGEDKRIREEFIPKLMTTSISAALIVRNEEKYIKECIESIEDFVNEIVIVDTGSTDKTLDILTELQSERPYLKIGHYKTPDDWSHPFVDNFAAARNVALDMCEGDWILQIDADERPINPQTIRATILSNKRHTDIGGFGVVLDCPSVAGTVGSSYTTSIRLFKKGMYYRNRCHETVDASIKESGMIVVLSPIRFFHLGYMTSVEENHEKALRNRVLLERQIVEEPDNSYAAFQYGFTMYLLKDQVTAEEYLRKAADLGISPPLEAAIRVTLGIIEYERKELIKAEEQCRYALKLAPRQSEGRVVLSTVLIELERYDEAIEQLAIVLDRTLVPNDLQDSDLANDKKYTTETVKQAINFCKTKIVEKDELH